MIYEILPVNNYQGNNNSTRFDFDFYIENESQLVVYFFDENDKKSKLELNVDYSIDKIKNKNGSYITFPLEGSKYSVLQENQKISIELTLPISQETQYNNSSLLNLEALEYSLDYLTRLIQILARKVARCVKVEECSKNTPDELVDAIKDAQKSALDSASFASSEARQALEQAEIAAQNALLASQYLNEILNSDFQPYDPNKKYSSGNWVVGEVDGEKYVFESLTDENVGNPLNDAVNWRKIDFTSTWGNIAGTLSNQKDLQIILDSKTDKEAAVNAAMPSGKYIDLNALSYSNASNSYVAPADGFVWLYGVSNSENNIHYFGFKNITTGMDIQTMLAAGTTGAGASAVLNVARGDRIQIVLTRATARNCRFYYANGGI